MRKNVATRKSAPVKPIFTHEGAPAVPITIEAQLRRSVLSCLLFEKEFYEDGIEIAQRIWTLAAQVNDPKVITDLAVEARTMHGLRHAPLVLLIDLIRRGGTGTAEVIAATLQRADEIGELINMYWRVNGRKMLTRQMRKGIGIALNQFDEYQFGKYGRHDSGDPVKLRDALFLSHPKPKDDGQQALFNKLVAKELAEPDTWEIALTKGADKKETFERLIRDGKLGYLALLRNLRNMDQAGCDRELVKAAILARKGARWVLPFRYTAAARAAPTFERELDKALMAWIDQAEPFTGETVVLVDVSGSMDAPLSGKSDMTRMLAAATLASVIPGKVRMFSFSTDVVEVPPRRGMAGVEAIVKSQSHGGTYLGKAVDAMNRLEWDRLIVVSDEQSHDPVGKPARAGYMINVASAKNGVGYGEGWTHIDGFSESVIRYVAEIERSV